MADSTSVEWDEGGWAELVAVIVRDIERRSLRVEGAAKRAAPVDTGRLRASITHEVEDHRAELEVVGRVGTNVEYAIYQELGTRFMSARPFLRPALDAAGGEVT